MALIVEDRVVETTATTGTGALALGGAVTGYQAFSAVCAVGDTVPYMIEAIDAAGKPTGAYESGLGTYSAANTLTRSIVTRSSNSNSAVNFATGAKRVFISANQAYLLAAGGIETPRKLKVPRVADFTQTNFQTGTSAFNTSKGCVIQSNANSGQMQWMNYPITAGADFTATFRVHKVRADGISGFQNAIVIRNSTNGRLEIWADYQAVNHIAQAWSNTSTFSGTIIGSANLGTSNFPWRRVKRSGNNLDWYISQDGEIWSGWAQGNTATGWAPSNFLENGTGLIDGIGFGVWPSGATAFANVGTVCTYFDITFP